MQEQESGGGGGTVQVKQGVGARGNNGTSTTLSLPNYVGVCGLVSTRLTGEGQYSILEYGLVFYSEIKKSYSFGVL